MGGEIDVSSAVDFGSTFTVRLPADRLSPLPASESDIVVEPEARPRAPLRVLAAEDNHVNQLVLKAILGQAGIIPSLVANGALAVEAWRDGAWDLVLMDVHMPVMDGVAAVQEIRRLETVEARSRTPIIALTANAMSHQVKSLLAEGFDDHVAKPIDVVTLFTALDRAMTPPTNASLTAA
jgi:CheY-like chemotaxis protein